MKVVTALALGSVLAAAGGAMHAQDESRREAVLADAWAALAQTAEKRNQSLKPGQAAWSTDMMRRLDGPLLFPSEHSWLHREPEVARAPVKVWGRVYDSSRAIIPGAELHLAPVDEAGYPVWENARNALSGDGGQFAFEDVPAGIYYLEAELTGFKVAETRVDARYERPMPVSLELEVGPSSDRVFAPQASPEVSLEAATVLSVEVPGGGFVPCLIRKANGLSSLGNRDYSEERLPFRSPREWQEAQARAGEFYAIALDLEAGPERFYPLLKSLAERMSSHRESMEIPFSALSPEQMLKALSGYLEYSLYRAWLRLEGMPLETLQGERRHPPISHADEAMAQQWLDDWDRRRSLVQSDLVRLGCFDSPHLEEVTPFLSAYLGISAPFLSKRVPLLEESPQQFLAIPFGMVTVYLDHPGTALTIQTFVIHD